MHNLFGKILKYFLWFCFAVILGSFLYGFAKFGFQPSVYIQYLNGIDAQQLLHGDSVVVETGTVLSGDVSTLTGTDEYDPNSEADIFGQTGTQQSGSITTGATTNESYGFLKNSDNSGQSLPTSVSTSGTNKSITPKTSTLSSGDARAQLLNLLKQEK